MLDLLAYMRSLEVLREFVVKCNNPKLCFLPAHGEVITDPVAKIDEYLAIRKKHIAKVRTDAFCASFVYKLRLPLAVTFGALRGGGARLPNVYFLQNLVTTHRRYNSV